MKRLRYMRHAISDKNGYVSQEELDRAKNMLPNEKYTNIFYGPIYRTIQTALAIVAGLETVYINEAIQEIGDGRTVDVAMDTVRWMDEKGTRIQDYLSFLGGELNVAIVVASRGLVKMFGLMNDGGYGLAVGHGPMIELLSGDKRKKIKNLEFVDFAQDHDGNITVV
ncbi:hypothetical protein KKA27_00515 [Patescibacteria group bacterium]|nr:hypothetical protein [Patescibacteria group bacterium]MBU2633129.1 hypothetical protein [Patescibacteria group bacterium]